MFAEFVELVGRIHARILAVDHGNGDEADQAICVPLCGYAVDMSPTSIARVSRADVIWVTVSLLIGAVLVALPLWFAATLTPVGDCAPGDTALTNNACFR